MLRDQHEQDFVEACDRILWQDEWFPPIARLKSMIDDCATDREQHNRRTQLTASAGSNLVCGTCHGSRFVRRGGYSPPNVQAGEPDSRARHCPDCTYEGQYAVGKERASVARDGGVRNPNGDFEVDRSQQTWPDALREYRLADGRMDTESLYRMSREMRGLDPNGDDRPVPVAGWTPIGRVAA